MKRLKFPILVFAGALTILVLLGFFLCTLTKSARRDFNVLLVIFDACRPDHLGCYGYARETSPNVDGIASKGVLFADATAQATWTKPAIASLLTSNYVSVHMADGDEVRLNDAFLTLPEILAENGYTTAFIFANGNAGYYNLSQGFHERIAIWTPDEFKAGLEDQSKHVVWHHAEHLTAEAIRWLEDNQNKNFFLYLHYLEPHAPYDPPEPFYSMFSGDLPGDVEGTMVGLQRVKKEGDPQQLEKMKAFYDGTISFTDYWLGKVLGELRRLGLNNRTIIVFTSDHGEAFMEHGLMQHRGEVYQEQIKVPFIFELPAGYGREDVVVHKPVMHIDIAPTILDLLGLPPASGFQGRSLAPFIVNSLRPFYALRRWLFPRNRTIVSEKLEASSKMIRVGRWKLIVDEQRERMFDLHGDKLESDNKYEEEDLFPAFPELGIGGKRAMLKKALKEWEMQVSQARALLGNLELEVEQLNDDRKRELRAMGYLD